MFQPVEVKALPAYRLWIRYSDGSEGEVDLSHLAGRGVFSLWDDYSEFEKVHIAEDRAIRWKEDVDICPDATYLKLTSKSPEDVFSNVKPASHA
jgi:hypothetical protein